MLAPADLALLAMTAPMAADTHLAICPECGAEFEQIKGTQVRCPACQDAAEALQRAERNRTKRATYKAQHNQGRVRLVYDPGWRSKAIPVEDYLDFSETLLEVNQFEAGLRHGIFPPGLLVQAPDKPACVICGGYGYQQHLELVMQTVKIGG